VRSAEVPGGVGCGPEPVAALPRHSRLC